MNDAERLEWYTLHHEARSHTREAHRAPALRR